MKSISGYLLGHKNVIQSKVVKNNLIRTNTKHEWIEFYCAKASYCTTLEKCDVSVTSIALWRVKSFMFRKALYLKSQIHPHSRIDIIQLVKKICGSYHFWLHWFRHRSSLFYPLLDITSEPTAKPVNCEITGFDGKEFNRKQIEV